MSRDSAIDPFQTNGRSVIADVMIGAVIAGAAVALRLALPLSPDLLPTLTVVVAVAVVTFFVGAVAGVTTAVIGGLLSWYLFFKPYSWEMDYRSSITLVGYAVITSVLLITSYLYRKSEHRRRQSEFAMARQEVERAELFAGEMAHRLKNALAIVQALASQTFREESAEVSKFAGRLKALSGAHNLLNEHIREPTASLEEVVHMALEPFANWDERIRISGPPVEIRDQQVVSLALVLHELGTNAVKYGALSNGHGRVEISWSSGGPRDFQLQWKERDGPPVIPPDRNGFGARLLSRQAMKSELAFEPDGIRCSIRSS